MCANVKVPNFNNNTTQGTEYGNNSVTNPVTSPVVSDHFYCTKPVTIREMVIRRINKTLCIFLLFTILVTFVSYYIAMNFEAKLNVLDREIVKINTENQDLQNDLDRYKSFNNVDSKIGEFKLLQKADRVLEVTAVNSSDIVVPGKKYNDSMFKWSIGY